MPPRRKIPQLPRVLARGGGCVASLLVLAQSALAALPAFEQPNRIELESFANFAAAGSPAGWRIAGGVANDPFVGRALDPTPGTGVLVKSGGTAAAADLTTTWSHGDLDLEIEFLLPRESEAGLLLQARYRVPLAATWREPGSVARAPGLWQRARIVFRAPRFDAAGKKFEPARLVRLELDDVAIATETVFSAPSPQSPHRDEVAAAPLVFAGAGGPIALRNITFIRRLDHRRVTLAHSRFKFYEGGTRSFGSYDSRAPTQEGAAETLRADVVPSPRPFALVFTGEIRVPASGQYSFHLETEKHAFSSTRLMVDDRELAAVPDKPGTLTAKLSAGPHRYRLDYLRGSIRGRPDLIWLVAGPETHPQPLIRSTENARNRPATPLRIEPGDGPALQRCFFAHPSGQRIYAAAVGSPAGVHYAYDLEGGALLAVWKGGFLDPAEMWHERGFAQEGRPLGSTLFLAAPALFADTGAEWESRGYDLAPDGQPTFRGDIDGQPVEDTIAPDRSEPVLTRTLRFPGGLRVTRNLVLTEAATITPCGDRFVIGDRSYYVRVPPAPAAVEVRAGKNGQELIATVPTAATEFSYSIVW